MYEYHVPISRKVVRVIDDEFIRQIIYCLDVL